MKNFLKNYKSSIILIFSIIIGGLIGIIFKEDANVLKPFGELFLNLLLVVIIPLIFLTLTTSIGKMKSPKRIGKILASTFIIFILTSLVSLLISFFSINKVNLVNKKDINQIKNILNANDIKESENINFLQRTVETISVNSFEKLLTNNNVIALIIFSIIFGIAINLSKEKGKKLLDVLDSANYVIQKFIKIIMYYAPIGLCCYFASLIGVLGTSLITGYTMLFIIYLIISLIMYFIIYSIYAFISAGKKGFISYWKNIIPTTLTSLATCSSAASIPINTLVTKKIGVSSDIADTTIPLGTNFHKDGSIIGSVFKIMFLVNLFNSNISSSKILTIAFIATLLVAAVPIGGGTISETLIITMLGFPLYTLPILTIIATIIDAPATVLNVVGDTASSMLVAKCIDGKNWINKT